ncbi:MAG: SHOCT domain-containing protein [Bacteroidota bacterium]
MEKNIYQILQDWHELLKSGAITENEFAAKKRELLGTDQKKENTTQKEQFIRVLTSEEQAQIDAEYDFLFNNKNWFQKNKSGIIGISIAVLAGLIIWYFIDNEAKSNNSIGYSIENQDSVSKKEEVDNLKAENVKLDSNIIWSTLYPGNINFDEDNRLIRKIIRDGVEYEFRTRLVYTFYYSKKQIPKAVAILYSYDFTNGSKADCHACHPEMEIATFEFSNGEWIKKKFIQNWEGSTGYWGDGAEIVFEKFNNIDCILVRSTYSNGGKSEDYITYYNAESLKVVKSKIEQW